MNIKEIKTRINEISHLLLDKHNAIGVSIGLKEKSGKLTDEIAVVFHVNSKKDISELSKESIIPRQFTHSGIDLITDVHESASFNSLSILDDDIEVNKTEIDSPEMDMGSLYDLSSENSKTIKLNSSTTKNLKPAAVNYWNDLESATVDQHRSKLRPLKGGTSSIYHKGSAATLGLIVSDKSDGSTVLLSNNHVYAASQFAGTNATLYGSMGNPLPLSTMQPSYTDGGDRSTDIVGKFKRVVPLTMVGNNFVDAAISTIEGVSIEDKVLNFNQNGPYEFASTAEIDSLLDVNSSNFKAPVFRSGRTLGPIGYPGNSVAQTSIRPIYGYENLTDINGISNIAYAELQRFGNGKQRDESIDVLNSRLVVRTTNKDHYVGGLIRDTSHQTSPTSNAPYRKYIPNNLNTNFTGEGLVSVGNFDYFDIGENLTLGISANEIMYYANFPNENSLVVPALIPGTTGLEIGSLPIRIGLAQGDDFVKLQLPIEIDTTFSDKTLSFQLSTNYSSKYFFSIYTDRYGGKYTEMGELSGDYCKVSDEMYMRKPIGSESYNNMPFFTRREDGNFMCFINLDEGYGRGRINLSSTTGGTFRDFNPGMTTTNIAAQLNIGMVNSSIDQSAIDTPIPAQDLSGIKKITNGYFNHIASGALWVLSGTDIFTVGSNGYQSTIGTGTHGTAHNLRTKLPGEWDDIQDFGASTVLALSTSGDLFHSTPLKQEANDIYRIPAYPKTTVTNSWELSANNLSKSMFGGKKFKKIFSKNNYYWIYAIDENDHLYWVNIWYQAAYQVFKNGSKTDTWNADTTRCVNSHGYSANHYFNEGNDLHFVNINGMTQRSLRDAKDASQTSFLFDQVKDQAGISGLTSTKMSQNYLSGSGTAFGWRTGGNFYDIDNFCGFDTTTNTWRLVGENTDNSFSDEETFNDDIIVTDVAANVRVSGFGGSSVIFNDCITIRSKNGHFPVTAGGDSGSAVFAKFGTTWKVIGLVFAGPTPTNTARGIVCRIDRIQEQLNIKPWDGQAYSDSISTQILDFNTNKLAPVAMTLSGREFSGIGVDSFF
tara:strand:+ start:7150 stop:10296 length:3147 start_codon:yes stop_codon:yes gene_type:complete